VDPELVMVALYADIKTKLHSVRSEYTILFYFKLPFMTLSRSISGKIQKDDSTIKRLPRAGETRLAQKGASHNTI
jgi:hypothetical protein